MIILSRKFVKESLCPVVVQFELAVAGGAELVKKRPARPANL
jgi:hypothetical protein